MAQEIKRDAMGRPIGLLENGRVTPVYSAGTLENPDMGFVGIDDLIKLFMASAGGQPQPAPVPGSGTFSPAMGTTPPIQSLFGSNVSLPVPEPKTGFEPIPIPDPMAPPPGAMSPAAAPAATTGQNNFWDDLGKNISSYADMLGSLS